MDCGHFLQESFDFLRDLLMFPSDSVDLFKGSVAVLKDSTGFLTFSRGLFFKFLLIS